MIKVVVKHIKWDLDVEDKKAELNLPTEYTFEIEDKDKNLLDDYDFVPDVLSDRFGFCVESCTYDFVPNVLSDRFGFYVESGTYNLLD